VGLCTAQPGWTILAVSFILTLTGRSFPIFIVTIPMEQPPPLPLEPGNVRATTATSMSLPARLLNIFAVPGEVFQEVKTSPNRASNWAVPMVLLALVGAISAFLVFSQPALMQKIREQQTKAFDAKVKAGKLTQEQADQIAAASEKWMTPQVMAIVGSVGAILASAVKTLWWGFILWLIAVWGLKTNISFAKSLEVSGLVMMIVVLGTMVGLLLTINLSRIGASPSLALMVSDFDIHRKDHLAMGAANVFNFWQVALMSLGLARLADVPFARAALFVFAFWIIQESLLILIGFGQMAL
jgi:hypothetical protein